MRQLAAQSLNILFLFYFYAGSFFALPLHCTGSVSYNTSLAKVSQWRGFNNDVTFDHMLYTGADLEKFGEEGCNFELG